MCFLRILFLFFTLSPCLVYAQIVAIEQYSLHDRTVSFMHGLQEEAATFYKQADSATKINQEERNKLLRQSSFFRQMSGYLKENRVVYENVRRQDFEKLDAPPIDLDQALHYTPLADSSITMLLENTDYASLLTFQSFTAETIMGLISNIMLPVIVKATPSNFYTDLALDSQIGSLIYGKQVSHDKWQLFTVNRHYCIRLGFNLATLAIDDIRFAVLSDNDFNPFQLSVLGKPKTTVDSLVQGLKRVGWDMLADTIYRHQSQVEVLQALAEKKQQFFTEHRDQYIQVREMLLTRFSPTGVSPPGFELKITGEELGSDFLQSIALLNPNIFTVETITNQLANTIPGQLSWVERPDYKALSLNAVIGYLHRANPTAKKNIWRVQAIGYRAVIEYQWDITTGEITELKYYEKV